MEREDSGNKESTWEELSTLELTALPPNLPGLCLDVSFSKKFSSGLD